MLDSLEYGFDVLFLVEGPTVGVDPCDAQLPYDLIVRSPIRPNLPALSFIERDGLLGQIVCGQIVCQ